MENKKAILFLENGNCFYGRSIGADGEKSGEVVFNTSLTGYEEILTDPSYYGQIVVMCYPHIGNYGINFDDAQSYKIWLNGFVVRECSEIHSNYTAKITLQKYLTQNKIIAIDGIDTRRIVRMIRENGSMKGIISTVDFDKKSLTQKLNEMSSIVGRNLVKDVCISGDSVFSRYKAAPNENKPLAAVIDYGTKLNILRSLEKKGFSVQVISPSSTLKNILEIKAEAVVFSNGPGDPSAVKEGIKLAKDLIEYNKTNYLPVLGICLGHQLLALGCGAKTYKLKFGHHGGNHPVKNLLTNKIEITVQNHNFCVDDKELSANFEITHRNLNDGTVEGIKHKNMPIISYQYHPEAAPGPHDSEYIFQEFKELLYAEKK